MISESRLNASQEILLKNNKASAIAQSKLEAVKGRLEKLSL